MYDNVYLGIFVLKSLLTYRGRREYMNLKIKCLDKCETIVEKEWKDENKYLLHDLYVCKTHWNDNVASKR